MIIIIPNTRTTCYECINTADFILQFTSVKIALCEDCMHELYNQIPK